MHLPGPAGLPETGIGWAAGPSLSMDTLVRGGRTARPAESGAGSLGSGGRAASTIRITLRGAASAVPAVSQGPSQNKQPETTGAPHYGAPAPDAKRCTDAGVKPSKSNAAPGQPRATPPSPTASPRPAEVEAAPQHTHVAPGNPTVSQAALAGAPPAGPQDESPRATGAHLAPKRRPSKRQKVEVDLLAGGTACKAQPFFVPFARYTMCVRVQAQAVEAHPGSHDSGQLCQAAAEEEAAVMQDVIAIMSNPPRPQQPQSKRKRDAQTKSQTPPLAAPALDQQVTSWKLKRGVLGFQQPVWPNSCEGTLQEAPLQRNQLDWCPGCKTSTPRA